jgi:integrase
MLPEIHFKPTPEDVLFLDYIEDFWTPSSAYVKERALVAKCPLSKYYISMNHDDVARHLRPFAGFKGKRLGDITTGLVLDWQRWAAESGLGPRRINAITSSMRVAVRYAVKRQDLPRDPFVGIGAAHEEAREKGVLTHEELAALVAAPLPDPRVKAAVLLAALCGLRRGEIRGLEWRDVDIVAGLIHVIHNYVDTEGRKSPKRGSVRSVPITRAIKATLDSLREVSNFTSPDDFVFAQLDSREAPLAESFFRYGMAKALEAIGISHESQRARNLTFHGLRHTFVTLGRMAGLSDLVMQTLAGHKSAAMMEHYSHAGQVLDFAAAREAIERGLAPGEAAAES